MQEKSPAGGTGGVPQPFSNSPKCGGYRGLDNKSTHMLQSEQGSPEGSPSGGVIGVSPNLSFFPHEWGIEGVDKS